MDSPFKHSFTGSYCQPPSLEKISVPTAGVEQRPVSNQVDLAMERTSESIGVIDLGLNSKAVASALKSLQEKIWCMEVERTKAEQNLKRLGLEASQYKNALEQEKKEVVNVKSQVTNEICAQLATVEGRCSLLEKQLDYMRNMVVQAETEKNILLEKQASLQLERYWDNAELQSKLEKLEILEQDCFKVNATQDRAENKIHELELKLQEEEHQRKLIQDKAAQLQTGLVMNQILMESTSARMKKKKKKKQGSGKISTGQEYIRPPSAWPKLADFPFVAGKSTSHSHSVTANVQNVFHLMKYHNTKINDGNQRPPERRTFTNSGERSYDSNTLKNEAPRSVSSCSSCTPSEGLSELLLALQDELGQMSFEHQDLLKQIQETKNTNVREDLERELDSLVKRMERKGDQICKLKKHQNNVEKLRQKARKLKRQAASVKKRAKDLDGMNELPVIPRGTEFSAKTTSALGQKGKESLQLLKNAQKLQMTLKKDDIVWDQ
ncbi:centrosomal protein CEP57L1 isoform X1 [Callorhinchus milii]|uniref:centrosomal protein CEP57L1 isoform X1 n=1 Tax=Callorhinchus milii TaxID=7868 RepID=UPI001C3F693E|nr:centrosomal protein CEP57L1 isoform X1 [Callorhinchus milii]